MAYCKRISSHPATTGIGFSLRRFYQAFLSCLVAASLVLGFTPCVARADDAPFTVSVGGSSITDIALSADTYTGGWPETTVPLYEVALPAGTTEVSLGFDEEIIAYSYASPSQYAGSCSAASATGDYADGGVTGELAATIRALEDGTIPMYVHVQTPYDDEWNSTFLYAIKLNVAPAEPVDDGGSTSDSDPSIAFTVSVGGSAITDIALSTDTYTGGWPEVTVPLYEVALPAGTTEVSLGFDEPRIAYSYTASGSYVASCSAASATGDYADGGVTGELAATVRALDDGTLPAYVQVQTPYDDEWNSTFLYAIKFNVASSPDPGPGPDDSDTDPAGLDMQKLNALYNNILASYNGVSEEWRVLDVCRANAVGYVNVDALKSAAQAALQDYGNTDLQRFALALFAAGETDLAKQCLDVIVSDPTCSVGANALAFQLQAFAAADAAGVGEPYTQAATTALDSLLQLQNADGGFGYVAGSSDTDVTAIVLAAFSTKKGSDTRVDAAIEAALGFVKSQQTENGDFKGYGGAVTGETTAMVVVALCALGMDPATTWVVEPDSTAMSALATSEGGASPLSALLTYASADQTMFTYNGAKNAMSTEEGFRALVAYKNFAARQAAYNIYVDGTALAPASTVDPADNGASDSGDNGANGANGANAGNNKGATTKQAPKTGDADLVYLYGVAGVALLIAGAASSLKKRNGRIS